MSRFQECLKVVLQHEGGKVDNKSDRGGRTAYGITQRVYSDYLTLRGAGREVELGAFLSEDERLALRHEALHVQDLLSAFAPQRREQVLKTLEYLLQEGYVLEKDQQLYWNE